MARGGFRQLTRLVGKGIGDFDLIAHGDRVLVALSGGKDSWSLLYALEHLRAKAPVTYELAAVTVHTGAEGFDTAAIEQRLAREGIPHHVIEGNIVQLVDEKLTEGTNPCSFCSRLRRGILYSYAADEGWNKIALGHHLDDFVETLVLNLFFNGSIKGMSPYLVSDDAKNTVIRPMVYVRETLTRECAGVLGVPLLGCACDCHGMKGTRRQWVKALLDKLEKDIPDIRSNLLGAMSRVHARHLLTPRNCENDNIPLSEE
jgi:tRNA 2-thiocytidine biosynthesis protein TtcA